MSETIITVRGHHSSWHRPERALVHAQVVVQRDSRPEAVAAATAGSGSLTATVGALHDPAAGPVTWWAADSVSVWSERPWSSDGAQLPPVFHARLGLRVRFSDFEALARWTEEAAGSDDVTITALEWELTEATRAAVTAEVRSRAVRDAVDKARVFAQSIGLSEVTATALADPGLLGDPGASATAGPSAAVGLLRAAESAQGLSFTPEDIAVEASVDARFVAR